MKKRNVAKILLFSLSFLILISVFMIGGCGKNSNIAWVYYDETACADGWETTNNNEVLKDRITSYFSGKGVRIYELEIFIDRTPDACSECSCKTGRRIKAKVKEREVDVMKSEGFYQ